jgi:glycosyltransferase involved in cell wall biosynthesis
MPLISVVIPTYNAEAVIDRALASVAAQIFQPAEVIIVDDGSTDRTFARVDEIQSRHIELPIKIITQPNKGPGASRNVGIYNATSDYVAFLDADDVWYPKKLERVDLAIKEHPEVDVFCHDEHIRSFDGVIKRRLRAGPGVDNMYEFLLFKGNCLLTSATVARREALLGVGGFPENRAFDSCEDWDLWLRLARAKYRFFFLSEVLGEWVRGSHTLTSNVERHFQAEINVLSHHLELSNAVRSHPQKCRRRFAQASYGKARNFYRVKAYRKAFSSFRECLRQDPLFLRAYVGIAILVCRLPL